PNEFWKCYRKKSRNSHEQPSCRLVLLSSTSKQAAISVPVDGTAACWSWQWPCRRPVPPSRAEQTGRKQAPREVDYYRPVVDTLWAHFGEDRLLFGSNWAVSERRVPFATVVGTVRDFFTVKGEGAATKFFLGNLQTAYAWWKR